jgi:hypothetical protein
MQVVIEAELVTKDQGRLMVSAAGRKVLSQAKSQGLRPLAVSLIRAGFFYDQASRLLEVASVGEDGAIACPLRLARQVAPQLTGLLQEWPGVTSGSTLCIPAALASELEAVWALLPPPAVAATPAEARRKAIGTRGELYSYQMERLNALLASDIVWVARDDEGLGWDIEDRSSAPHRRIEVKASGEREVRFFVSSNEWSKAKEEPDLYEVHFWGGVDLNEPPAEQFTRLRKAGFPRIFQNLHQHIAEGVLDAAADRWRITMARE